MGHDDQYPPIPKDVVYWMPESVTDAYMWIQFWHDNTVSDHSSEPNNINDGDVLSGGKF